MPSKKEMRFEILRPLGEGGMGQVFLAEDRSTGQPVAIKFLRQGVSPQFREAFREEVKLLSHLSHPNLVKIFDYFEDPNTLVSTELDGPFFSMEYVEGKSLQDLSAPPKTEAALKIFAEVCQGLHYLHTRNILHRDLKPANVMLPPDGIPKILDFGLSAVAQTQRQSQSPRGTLIYLPPEAFWGDYQFFSDLFSLGVIFYEVLSNRLPFEKPLSQDPTRIPAPPPLEELRPDLPSFFTNLIHKLLALSPSDRPSSAASLIRYLNEHVDTPFALLEEENLSALFLKTPLVGRDRELQEARRLLSREISTTPPRLITLQGPTGVGRTRMLDEIKWEAQLKGYRFLGLSPDRSSEWWKKLVGEAGDLFLKPGLLFDILPQKRLLAFQDIHLWDNEALERIPIFLKLLQEKSSPWILLFEWNEEYTQAQLQNVLDGVKKWPAHIDLLLKDLSAQESIALLRESGLANSIPEDIQKEMIQASGGRPLLLLESLRQMLSEGLPAPGKKKRTFTGPKSFKEVSARRVQALDPLAQDLLALLLSARRAPSYAELWKVWPGDRKQFENSYLELQSQNLIRPGDATKNLQLTTPSLRKLFYEALEPKSLQRAHQCWLDFYLKEGGPEPKSQPVSIAIVHHARALKQKKVFKAWGFPAVELLMQMGREEEAVRNLNYFLKIATTAQERSMAHAHLAPYYFRRGDFDQSLKAYDLWFKDRQDDESRLQKLKHHFYSGLVHLSAGDRELSEKRLREGLRLGDAEKFPPHSPYLARAHLLLGRIAEDRGDLAQAQRQFAQALPLAKTSPILLGEVEDNLGRLHRELHQYEKAKVHYTQSQNLFSKAKNPQAEAIAHQALGLLYREQGLLKKALHAMDESLKLSEAGGALLQWAQYEANRALVFRDLGDYGLARESLDHAASILEPLGKSEQEIILQIQQANLFFLVGNFSRGMRLLEKIQTTEEMPDQKGWDLSLKLLSAEAAVLQKRYWQAFQLYSEILQEKNAEKNSSEYLAAQIGRAQLLLRSHELDPKANWFQQLTQTLSEREGPFFRLWDKLFSFLSLSPEARLEAQLKEVLKEIQISEAPELRVECYGLLARDFYHHGLTGLATRFQESAALEWKKLLNSLPEELKMDYEKNRSLTDLEDDLGKLLPSEAPNSPAPIAPAAAPKGSAQISEMRFRQLTEINRQIGKKRNLTDILERVMDASIELTGAERGFLLLRSEEAEEGPVVGFEVKTARHLNQTSLMEKDFQFSMTAVKQAMSQGSFILTDNAQLDERFHEKQSVMQFQLKAILAVPLEIEGQVLGAIYLDHRFQPGCFTEEDVVVLSAFAAQAALAIEKAQILEELSIAKEQLEEKVETQAKHIEVLTGKLANAREDLRYEYGEIIGQSPPMMRVFQLLDHVTETTIPVWIKGDSGTGKELVARSLHYNSPRKDGPFISENCSAIPETLLESELFGHKKGAFTHADRDRQGLFEQASKGTLFLDEIGDMSLAMQAKLLRVLQEGEIRPVGSSKKIKVDVRLVTASHRDLTQMVSVNKFRQDLFYRVNGLTIVLPPLRERTEDIPLLARALIEKAAKEFNLQPSEITDEAYQVLYRYPWPGNIRELEGTLRNALLFAKGRPIGPEFLTLNPAIAGGTPSAAITAAPTSASMETNAEEAEEKQVILDSLRRHEMNKGGVAEELGISLRTLYTRMDKLGIPKKKSVLSKYLGMG